MNGFSLAPAGERTLAAGDYLLGCLVLAVIAGAVGFTAWRARGLVLAGWTGAPARLVELVLGLAILVWLSEALGTFGAFTAEGMVIGALALAVGVGVLGGRLGARRAAGPSAPPAPRASSTASWLAAAACAAVLAGWMVPTLASLAGGMDRADTLWYHMPLAARWFQTGDLAAVDFFDPIFFAAYYPANSEVFHAVPLLAFERDILSPLLNVGFLGLGLLASYCVGRPYGLGPQALIGGAVALGAQHLIEFQAGEALNDVVGVAFVLSAVAVLVNGVAARAGRGAEPADDAPARLTPAVLALAGVAAGLAAGTKLSFLAPVLALALGAAWVSASGVAARLKAFAWFSVPAFAAGGYWYLKNLFAVGNPIPYTSWGPLGLPAPERAFELRPGNSVAHYLTDLDVWQDWFVPGLNESFGALWPLTLLAVVGGALFALVRGGEPLLRVLGAVVLFTVVAYVFTPLTAAGEEGEPIAFEWNVRYVAPAAAIALAMLPCLPPLRASARAREAVLAGLSLLLAATVASLVQWEQGHVKGALAAGLGALTAFALARWLLAGGRIAPAARRRWAAGIAALLAAGAVGAGWWEQNHYLERRYENTSPRLRLAEALRWARDLRDARVAVAGVRGVFNQYPFYGTDLSNHVQWLGEEGEEGAFLRIPTCAEWRRALADGEYTHVVTTYDPFDPGALTDTKEAVWTREDPGAEEILDDGPVSVFELTAPPDPAGCEDLPDLSPAELNGDSVNADPTANQPPARLAR